MLDSDTEKAKQILANAISEASKDNPDQRDRKTASDAIQHIKKILNGESFGDKWLTYIESGVDKLSKDNSLLSSYCFSGFLDSPPELDTVAYVLIDVSTQHWSSVNSSLRNIPEVKEAALILGSPDVHAIAKIQAPSKRFNTILLRELSIHPHINKTQTLQAIPYSHWQKDQKGYEAKLERLPFIHTEFEDLQISAHSEIIFPSIEMEDLFKREEDYKKITIKKYA